MFIQQDADLLFIADFAKFSCCEIFNEVPPNN